jgi:3-hydroxyisobutyrate dehydrogenase-like beta-hydroxyacid dehydrogenase
MTAFARVALIGFGEVGQTLAADLLAQSVAVSAYDVLFPQADSAPVRALKTIPVRAARSAADAAAGAELVISAVTAASDLEAARAVTAGLERDAFFLDVNSASPGMKQASSKLIDTAGGRYVEAAVMTPIAPKRIGSYMLLGGAHAAAFIERARGLGFTGEVFSDSVGPAAATKMCRSVIIKGVEALVSESLLTARYFGVEQTVLNSLSDLLPVGDWNQLARYLISRSLEHGVRRAEEMREAAQTVAEAGVAPLMSRATAERQDQAAAHRAALAQAGDLGRLLDAIRRDLAPEREEDRAVPAELLATTIL